MIRVLVVDDHAILRDGIRSILASQEDMIVVGEAGDGHKAVEYTGTLSPDIVLMDLSMPGLNGLEATRAIKEQFPHVKVLILTQHDNREYIMPVLQAGAAGYVLKRSGRREMLSAIRQVHEEGAFLASSITHQVLQEYSQRERYNGGEEQHLTERELQVLKLTAEGKSNKEIAQALGISPKTVSVHRTNVMGKLGAQNTVEMLRLAAREHLVGPEFAE